jgi:hypothetical protein
MLNKLMDYFSGWFTLGAALGGFIFGFSVVQFLLLLFADAFYYSIYLKHLFR